SAAAGSCTEHGPPTTKSRASLRSRIARTALRPPSTVCAASSVSGRRSCTSCGEGVSAIASAVRVSEGGWRGGGWLCMAQYCASSPAPKKKAQLAAALSSPPVSARIRRGDPGASAGARGRQILERRGGQRIGRGDIDHREKERHRRIRIAGVPFRDFGGRARKKARE